MQYLLQDYNQGLAAIKADPNLGTLWEEVLSAISEVSEEDIKVFFKSQKRKAKSISEAINYLLNEKLVDKGWDRQSPIFKDEDLSEKTWTLDFSKGITDANGRTSGIPIEVVFNHGEAIAWNLIKLSLATESSVQKKFHFNTGVGVYICATDSLKMLGGFDGSIGEYERVLKYLVPLDQKMIKPLVIIGLLPPKTFRIKRFPKDYHVANLRNRSTGELEETI